MAKPEHTFHLVFSNLPKTDEEWKRENEWRAKLRETVMDPQRYPELKHRPVWSFKHGPSCHSHKEARKHCEAAIALGAQLVKYSVWGPKAQRGEVWELRKGGHWRKISS